MLWSAHLTRPKLKHAKGEEEEGKSSYRDKGPSLCSSADWSAKPEAEKGYLQHHCCCSHSLWCHQGTIYLQNSLVNAGSPAVKSRQRCEQQELTSLLLMSKCFTGTQLLRSNYSPKFPLLTVKRDGVNLTWLRVRIWLKLLPAGDTKYFFFLGCFNLCFLLCFCLVLFWIVHIF